MATQKIALDRIDHGIIEELQNNARLSNKELAARIGLAPSSCLERVRRLTTAEVLTGFEAQVAPEAMGVGLAAMISVQLGRHGRRTIEVVRDRLATLPEVLQLFHVGGSQDLLVHVAVRDADHLREFVMDHLSSQDEVAHIETALLFEHIRSPLRPLGEGES
jgi:DNA-binding Lrp family transcriptional regulator